MNSFKVGIGVDGPSTEVGIGVDGPSAEGNTYDSLLQEQVKMLSF